MKKVVDDSIGNDSQGLSEIKKVVVEFLDNNLYLDLSWRHELAYFNYIKGAEFNGPINFDVWVFDKFVECGDVVVDAGSNIGFTSLLAKHSGAKRVHCIEPDPRVLEKLKANCVGEVFRIHECGLGEKKGAGVMKLSTIHNQGSTLCDKMVEKFPSVFHNSIEIDIPIDSLDNLFLHERIDFLKVDVEGAELSLLKGAQEIFEDQKPGVVYIEAYQEFFDEVNSYLEKYYDKVYRVVSNKDGECMLLDPDSDFRELNRTGVFVNPPSFIYTDKDLSNYMHNWSKPSYK